MPIYIDTSRHGEGPTKASLHLMPCKIEHNDAANVTAYFATGVRPDRETDSHQNEKGYTASFRGRPLKGEKLCLPHGYTGVVMREKRSDEGEDRTMRVTHTFEDFTYWNLDLRPSVNDKIVQAMDWVNLAKVIHRPVNEDSSQRSTVGK